MSNYDDLFKKENKTPAPQEKQPFDKEAWKQKKWEQREKIYSMIDDTVDSITEDGAIFQKYLDVQSRFNRYSVANALLIFAQRPDATRIADFEAWKEQGTFIRKNETGFYILEPGEEYPRDDGTTGISYNLKKMFDISQTDAQEHKPPAYPDERTRIKALMEHAPVPIKISDSLPEGINAFYQPDTREIQIRKGMDADTIFRSLSQELAHAEMDKGDGSYNRSNHTFHAYCISYMLCRRYGVNTDSYSFDNVPEMFELMDVKEIRSELSIIREAAGEISGRMSRILMQQKEQKQPEPER